MTPLELDTAALAAEVMRQAPEINSSDALSIAHQMQAARRLRLWAYRVCVALALLSLMAVAAAGVLMVMR